MVPEKLDYFIIKYAEHIHEKWCLEKVGEDGVKRCVCELTAQFSEVLLLRVCSSPTAGPSGNRRARAPKLTTC